MANLFIGGKFQAIGAGGLALPGALLYTYAAGGLTPLATYTDQAGGSSNDNPIVCDSSGQADVWIGTAAYRMILKTAAGVTVWNVDHIRAPMAEFADATGLSLIGFIQAGTGAVPRTGQDKARERVTSLDYAKGDYNGTTGTDDTAALQAALTYVMGTYDPVTYASNSPAAGSCTLWSQAGNYKVNGTITLTKKVAMRGDGPAERSSGARLLQFNNAVDLIQVNPISAGMSFSMEDMTIAGTAGGAGHLLRSTGATGACNSARILRNFFASPGSKSVWWERGDDLRIVTNVFDVSNASAIALGTSTAANAVTNSNVEDNDFFEIPSQAILLFNVSVLSISNNRVTRQAATRTNYFIDGYNTLPYQLKNIRVEGNHLNSVDCLIKATAVSGLKIIGNDGLLMGAGAGATLSCIELTGLCTSVSLIGNTLSGTFDTKNFYNDSAATAGLVGTITGNTFINTGGTGQALVCGNTTGAGTVIANNTFVGFTSPSVSERVTTTGSAIAPGTVNAGATFTSAGFTVTGARAGDKVTVGFSGTTFPLAAGLTIDGLVTANDTVKFVVRNGTAGNLAVAAFDITYCVTRGT